MTIKEIFTKLSNRMVGAMMVHTQLTELFTFVDLIPDMNRQKKQLHEETDGLLELERYCDQHHHLLVTANSPPSIDILNLGLLKKSNGELSPNDRAYLIQYGMKEWIKWEKESKIIYEDAYRNLVSISEIAAADFVMKYIHDVDNELMNAELLYRVRDGIDWDLATIYQNQVG